MVRMGRAIGGDGKGGDKKEGKGCTGRNRKGMGVEEKGIDGEMRGRRLRESREVGNRTRVEGREEGENGKRTRRTGWALGERERTGGRKETRKTKSIGATYIGAFLSSMNQKMQVSLF